MDSRIVASALELIGETPLVQLERIRSPKSARILGKLESSNPGGSVKDRSALAMVEQAEAEGILAPGGTIIEPTGGNAGISLAMVAAVKGYRLILTMPEDAGWERRALANHFGAEIVLTPLAEGMAGAVFAAEDLAVKHGYFYPRQFENPANPQSHRQTAREIIAQTGGALDAFVAGVGTGGTVTGVAQELREQGIAARIVAVEPARSPVLSGGAPSLHGIPGIGPGFVPETLDRKLIDEVVPVTDGDAFEAARMMAAKEGLLVGISAGAAVFAALQVAESLGPEATVVVMLPDTGERYLGSVQLREIARELELNGSPLGTAVQGRATIGD